MPEIITDLRVFIASPSGVDEERRLFQQRLTTFNNLDPLDRDVIFTPVGWEKTLRGVGRPQAKINMDLMKCDFLVLLFADRWGSSPDAESEYSSGCEEEFELAVSLLNDDSVPMSEIIIFFKAIDQNSVKDREQYEKVLAFKESLSREQKHFYDTFENGNDFADSLDRHLHSWAKNHGKRILEQPIESSNSSSMPSSKSTSKQQHEQKKTSIELSLSAAWQAAIAPPEIIILWSPNNVLDENRATDFAYPPKRTGTIRLSITNNAHVPELIKSFGFTLKNGAKLELNSVSLTEPTKPNEQISTPYEVTSGRTINATFSIDELLYARGVFFLRENSTGNKSSLEPFSLLPEITGLYVETAFDIIIEEPNFAFNDMVADIKKRIKQDSRR